MWGRDTNNLYADQRSNWGGDLWGVSYQFSAAKAPKIGVLDNFGTQNSTFSDFTLPEARMKIFGFKKP